MIGMELTLSDMKFRRLTDCRKQCVGRNREVKGGGQGNQFEVLHVLMN